MTEPLVVNSTSKSTVSSPSRAAWAAASKVKVTTNVSSFSSTDKKSSAFSRTDSSTLSTSNNKASNETPEFCTAVLTESTLWTLMERPTATKERLWWSWMAGSPTRMPLKPHRTDNRRLTAMMELAPRWNSGRDVQKVQESMGETCMLATFALFTPGCRRFASSFLFKWAKSFCKPVDYAFEVLRWTLLHEVELRKLPRFGEASKSPSPSQICSELVHQNLPLVNGHLSCWCDCVLARRTWHRYPTNPPLDWAWRATWPPSSASCKIFLERLGLLPKQQ